MENPRETGGAPAWLASLEHCPWLLWTITTGVAVLRAFQCFEIPAKTGDIYRHILTGVMIRDAGWSAAAQPLSAWWPDAASIAPWAEVPYNYPPLALLFFVIVAHLGPSVLVAKALLTGLELFNAFLVFRITHSRVLGVAYWSLPLSIWWVSREAQFEPLQSTFVLLALLGLERGHAWSWGAWILAGQTKLSAVFLLPRFLHSALRSDGPLRTKALTWSLLATVPSVVACLLWPMPRQVLATFAWDGSWNPWHWSALWETRYSLWCQLPLLIWIKLATLLLAGFLVLLVRRSEVEISAAAAPLLFLVASALMGIFHGWYFCALIPLVLISRNTALTLLLMVVVQLCEPLSVYQLVVQPVGWGAPHAFVQATDFLGKP